MDHLGETIHHREDDRLATHLGKTLDEVHGDVALYGRRNLEGLKQSRGMQMFCLVPLTDKSPPDVVADELGHLRAVEVGTQALESLLDAIMANAMGMVEQLRPKRRRCRNVDATLV